MTRLPETLTGARIELRLPRPEDAEQLFAAVCSHAAVARYLTWHPHESADQTRGVLEQIIRANDAQHPEEQTWIIHLEGEPAGMFSCWWEGGEVELGFCLGPAHWRRGYMREALGLVLGALAQDTAVTRVWASTDVDNTGSAATLRGAGFELKAELPAHAVHPNIEPGPRDSLLFEVDLTEHDPRPRVLSGQR